MLPEGGSVIPGLYAAGACASNIAQDGKGYGSGTSSAKARSSAGGPGRTQREAKRASVELEKRAAVQAHRRRGAGGADRGAVPAWGDG